jgi:hypothetical protein
MQFLVTRHANTHRQCATVSKLVNEKTQADGCLTGSVRGYEVRRLSAGSIATTSVANSVTFRPLPALDSRNLKSVGRQP